MSLDGKVAIVTAGGGPGIGSAIVRALAAAGASVGVADVDGKRAESVAAEVTESGGNALPIVADVSDKEQAVRMVERTVETFGKLHILINHAGVGVREPIEQMSPESWRQVREVSLDGTFFCTQAAVPFMRAEGWGRVVSTASWAAYRTCPSAVKLGLSSYAAAKAGVIGFSRAAAAELGPLGITVNVVAPGLTSGSGMSGEPTTLTREQEVERAHDEQQILRPRFVRPEEIAAGVMYFVGPGSDRTTGQVLHVNGGSYFGG